MLRGAVFLWTQCMIKHKLEHDSKCTARSKRTVEAVKAVQD